mmetsp:Transcript_20428/g.48632  ORF Transcript_20428/g.48632 Transcript_20428/m.48632 type:complete len:364 (+) Transcript_20428:112-1203(+)
MAVSALGAMLQGLFQGGGGSAHAESCSLVERSRRCRALMYPSVRWSETKESPSTACASARRSAGSSCSSYVSAGRVPFPMRSLASSSWLLGAVGNRWKILPGWKSCSCRNSSPPPSPLRPASASLSDLSTASPTTSRTSRTFCSSPSMPATTFISCMLSSPAIALSMCFMQFTVTSRLRIVDRGTMSELLTKTWMLATSSGERLSSGVHTGGGANANTDMSARAPSGRPADHSRARWRRQSAIIMATPAPRLCPVRTILYPGRLSRAFLSTGMTVGSMSSACLAMPLWLCPRPSRTGAGIATRSLMTSRRVIVPRTTTITLRVRWSTNTACRGRLASKFGSSSDMTLRSRSRRAIPASSGFDL